MEQGEIQLLHNTGLLTLNPPDKREAKKTLIVLGVARSGTSMVAGALHHMGIHMGEGLSNVFEDALLGAAAEKRDHALFKQLVKKRDTQHVLWGWKRPDAIQYIDSLAPLFRNPYFIVVFRDVFAIANRNRISMGAGIVANMEAALNGYFKLMHFLKTTRRPCLLVSYEKALVHKELFVSSLANFLEVGDYDKKAVLDFITTDPAGYLNESRVERPDGVVPPAVRRKSHIRQGPAWKAALDRIRRTGTLVWMAPAALQIAGGWRPLLDKATRIYRHEGFTGIKRGLALVETHGAGLDRYDYLDWIRRYDTIDPVMRGRIQQRIGRMAQPPLISVIMPTYNPNLTWLEQAVASVRGQLYPHWELCIADDASGDPSVRQLLARLAREEPRVKLVFRERNGHISAASNSALALAAGQWVALLDHDDLLPEHALYCVADTILNNPEARLIYSDEDKIDAAGKRFNPYFKCDWNPDLFYSQNMFSHLGVYQKELVEEVGGFREGFEGSQDYDLALRCIERVSSKAIVHIPRVLYHWRVHQHSAARSAEEAKPYAMVAGERAINAHFQRCGFQGRVELIGYGYRPRYRLPAKPPLVSLIIPTRNGLTLLRQCIASITERTTYPNYEIVVVDNGSDDPDTLAYLKRLTCDGNVRVLRDERPFNFAALNNDAVDQADGEVIGLLNNDVEVITPEWLTEMVSHALRPGIGAVGAKLLFPNNTVQHGGVILGLGGAAGHAHMNFSSLSHGYFGRLGLVSNFSAVTAACLVVRKSLYRQVGGMDAQNLAIAFNDVDFCLRLREAGMRNVLVPYALLYHHESSSRGYEANPQKQLRFQQEGDYIERRWGEWVRRDPAYSPNLTLEHADFSYAWPPRVGQLA